jgi:uncharacterized protein YcbK (DUF882 family)
MKGGSMEVTPPKPEINKIYVSPHFKLSEFQSPDTKEVMVHPALVQKLETMRNMLNVPIYVTSGYRTPEHNAAVHGHPNSQHMRGEAADIRIPGVPIEKIKKVATEVGFTHIIYYEDKNFFHLGL